jgi:hypothetical protein
LQNPSWAAPIDAKLEKIWGMVGGGGNKQTNIQNPRKKIQLVGTCVDPWQKNLILIKI